MKISPYLEFDGNCKDAIAFYEKVFGAKAEFLLYEDMPKFDQSMPVPAGKEKWVMHGSMKFADGAEMQFADNDENGKSVGANICLQLTYKTAEEVKAVYDALKVSAKKIIFEMQPTFYAPQYAELIDGFGVRWSVMQG